MSLPVANLRWVTTNLDHKRIPLNGSERGERQGDIPYWGANGIVDYVDDYLINEPVVLIGEDGAPFLDPHKEVAFEVDGPIWPNNHIHILRPDREKVTDGFLRHWLNTVPYALYINGSTRDKLTQAQLGSIKIELPPLETQKRIAAFLDEKTAQIDALIARKQALLARLAEKRQAIITQAVTKGLNPAAPLKDSGIDWLGQIPAHWEVWALKRVLATSAYGISASLEPTGNVAILRMGNLQNGELDFTDLRFLDEIDAGLLLKNRDVVFNRTNSLDLVGKAAIYRGSYDGDLSLASYLVLFRFDHRYDPEFANYVMSTSVLMALGRTLALPSIGQANLNPSRYAAIDFPIPPIGEQVEVVSFIAKQLAMLAEMENKVAGSISKLIEYRSALITSAVTGQMDI